MCFGSFVIILGEFDMADPHHAALIQSLRRIGSKHPDMVARWENAVNELYHHAMGNNMTNEIRLAFDAIKECPTADVDNAKH